jgi:hypothetical protein
MGHLASVHICNLFTLKNTSADGFSMKAAVTFHVIHKEDWGQFQNLERGIRVFAGAGEDL